jgi:recombination protein RecR
LALRAHKKIGLFLVQNPHSAAELLSSLQAAQALHPCPECGNLAEAELCPICADPERERSLICVVETVSDLMAIERSGEYGGLYHVLGGALNPLEGIGPEQLNLEKLFARLQGISEVILATGMTVEGEATAGFLAERLSQLGVRSTRLAYGLPVGGSLEYADEVTLARALENRRGYP